MHQHLFDKWHILGFNRINQVNFFSLVALNMHGVSMLLIESEPKMIRFWAQGKNKRFNTLKTFTIILGQIFMCCKEKIYEFEMALRLFWAWGDKLKIV